MFPVQIEQKENFRPVDNFAPFRQQKKAVDKMPVNFRI